MTPPNIGGNPDASPQEAKTSNLVSTLRAGIDSCCLWACTELQNKAADEIERLTAEKALYHGRAAAYLIQRDRLREALYNLVRAHNGYQHGVGACICAAHEDARKLLNITRGDERPADETTDQRLCYASGVGGMCRLPHGHSGTHEFL